MLSSKNLFIITLVLWIIGPVLFFSNSSTEFGGGNMNLLVLGGFLAVVGVFTFAMAIAARFNKKSKEDSKIE